MYRGGISIICEIILHTVTEVWMMKLYWRPQFPMFLSYAHFCEKYIQLSELKKIDNESSIQVQSTINKNDKPAVNRTSHSRKVNNDDKNIVAELAQVKAKLQEVSAISEKRARAIHEVNEILDENPKLKSDYIKAKTEHMQNRTTEKQSSNKTLNTNNKPKHKR